MGGGTHKRSIRNDDEAQEVRGERAFNAITAGDVRPRDVLPAYDDGVADGESGESLAELIAG